MEVGTSGLASPPLSLQRVEIKGMADRTLPIHTTLKLTPALPQTRPLASEGRGAWTSGRGAS